MENKMTLTNRLATTWVKRTLTVGLLAVALATGSAIRFGGTQAHAFDEGISERNGTQFAVYTRSHGIVCSPGAVWLQNGNLYTQEVMAGNVTYRMWLYRWDGQGWSLYYQNDVSDHRTMSAQYASQNWPLQFLGLPAGSYTVVLRFDFDLSGVYVGSSTWRPTVSDYWGPSGWYKGAQYCTI
jgi:hypothetical protein